MMTAETALSAFHLSALRSIAADRGAAIHSREQAAKRLLEKSPHETDKTIACTVLADLETIAKIEVI